MVVLSHFPPLTALSLLKLKDDFFLSAFSGVVRKMATTRGCWKEHGMEVDRTLENAHLLTHSDCILSEKILARMFEKKHTKAVEKLENCQLESKVAWILLKPSVHFGSKDGVIHLWESNIM